MPCPLLRSLLLVLSYVLLIGCLHLIILMLFVIRLVSWFVNYVPCLICTCFVSLLLYMTIYTIVTLIKHVIIKNSVKS